MGRVIGRPFAKGNTGRPVGSKNKNSKMVKEVFAEVFNELQNDPKAKLIEWAKREPTEFYRLAAKLIPVQLTQDENENPITIIGVKII